ncbi:hypothetical protein MGM1_2370 [Candidatus Malacoplasma girerdii]|uniref:Uncharacterized protein n=1 Tax=Candidatus Malacoplasma girerdii TaxID=1318617 RepID=A0A097SSP3_9BACT|nr:hypothetical protein MGM1_2370 [Candidatus Malacoplasma girerdii]ASJ89026.1 MAG: bacteriocin, class IIb, lactobin A/cerein 7B family protein [Candidatus Malacoplasma girerdii]
MRQLTKQEKLNLNGGVFPWAAAVCIGMAITAAAGIVNNIVSCVSQANGSNQYQRNSYYSPGRTRTYYRLAANPQYSSIGMLTY